MIGSRRQKKHFDADAEARRLRTILGPYKPVHDPEQALTPADNDAIIERAMAEFRLRQAPARAPRTTRRRVLAWATGGAGRAAAGLAAIFSVQRKGKR